MAETIHNVSQDFRKFQNDFAHMNRCLADAVLLRSRVHNLVTFVDDGAQIV